MFFCIGAQKAGTTWLHDYLSRSPEVHFSRVKELHYFDVRARRHLQALPERIKAIHRLADRLDPHKPRLNKALVDQLRDAAELLSIHTGPDQGEHRHDPYLDYLLKGRTTQPVVGDITPSYAMLSREHFAEMAEIGQARFLFILRDPVSRMWSQVRMRVSANAKEDLDPEEMLRRCSDRVRGLENIEVGPLTGRAGYLRTITELEAAVPAERILHVFYEELFTGPATARICDFLGIPHIPPETSNRVNEGTPIALPDDIRAILRRALDAEYEGIRARFGARVPASWQD
jgi:hypothetical protein